MNASLSTAQYCHYCSKKITASVNFLGGHNNLNYSALYQYDKVSIKLNEDFSIDQIKTFGVITPIFMLKLFKKYNRKKAMEVYSECTSNFLDHSFYSRYLFDIDENYNITSRANYTYIDIKKYSIKYSMFDDKMYVFSNDIFPYKKESLFEYKTDDVHAIIEKYEKLKFFR